MKCNYCNDKNTKNLTIHIETGDIIPIFVCEEHYKLGINHRKRLLTDKEYVKLFKIIS